MTQKRYPKRFPLKIIMGYLVLAAIAVVVSIILYSELQNYFAIESIKDENKVVETGELINLVYETDSFSRLALLSEKEEDFEQYQQMVDSLYQAIADFKELTEDKNQQNQLDSLRSLLISKNKNIAQLHELNLEINKDTSLDDILKEFQNLEDNMGRFTPQNFLGTRYRSRKERESYNRIIEIMNNLQGKDTMKVPAKLIDSTLAATRFIVAEAKYIRNKTKEELREKESELIANDLIISKKLRELISTFDAEITANYMTEKNTQERSVEKASSVLKIAGAIGILVIMLFSYIIITDFFKAEKLRKKLRVAKEETEEVLKSREQLIATVSHDLKTPLHTIAGYTELFQNTPLSEKQTYYANQIASGSHFITELVNDLLDFSKLEAGKLKIDHAPFMLDTLLIESGNAVKDRFLDKPVSLEISIDEHLKNRYFKSDPLRIKQIVLNLVSNAFKFTSEGSVTITAEIISENDTITKTKITVVDTGIGISTEKQELIFNEFTQAEEDTSKKFGGTGLGLAISKQLAGLLGGSIQVQSRIDEGSAFAIMLPLENVADNQAGSAVESETKEKSLADLKLKALVFDDDPSMRSLLAEVLEQEGIHCNTFEKFSDFETVAGAVDYDFVLTDIQMPGTDGFQVLAALQEGGAMYRYGDQPVIAMTGDQTHKSNYYYEQGFSQLMHKPFHKYELMQTLHTLFGTTADVDDRTNDISDANDSIYDLGLLKSFLNDDKALSEIISVFLMQTHKDLDELHLAIEENDFDTVRALSHRKLTMTRQLQANKVVPILEKMEKVENNDATLKNLYQEVVKEIETLTTALQKEIV